MRYPTVVSLSLVIICSICLLGFVSSAEEPDASHSVIVFENVESSVVAVNEEKRNACTFDAGTTINVSVDPCQYQLGAVGNQPVCFSFACQLDYCCLGSCPGEGGGPSEQEDPGMWA